MSHQVETMAYAFQENVAGYEVPWHGLGKKVLPDLTPEQMLIEAGLDWEVQKFPAHVTVDGQEIPTGKEALVRTSDNKILDTVGEDWNPLQNAEAFGFFAEFIEAGNMEMHTAGSLNDGRNVWGLAKVKGSAFELFGKDRVEAHLLFSNPHQYGKSINVIFTPTRVVCKNTLSFALNAGSSNMVKVSHRVAFDAEQVKETMGIAEAKLDGYKERAEFISSKRFTEQSKTEYLETLFPVLGEAKRKKRSKPAQDIMDILDTQPGAEMGEGTFWQLFNGVTYYTDHLYGRNDNNRMNSAWFGGGAKKKTQALNLAVKMAEAA